jgi:hypothetical protein
MSLSRKIRWNNIMRLVSILVFISMIILSVYNFIKISNLMEKHKLSEERVAEIYKHLEDTTLSFENRIKEISAEFISENDFDTVFIIGKTDRRSKYYRDIKITDNGSDKGLYENDGYHVIGELKSLQMKQ